MDEQETKQPAGEPGREDAKDSEQRRELNAMLAQLAGQGNRMALAQLWELNRPVLHTMFWRWYGQHQVTADAAGVTIEDLEQEGYFAVQEAAEGYDPSRGSFLALLQYRVKHRIRAAVCCGHVRKATTEDGRSVRIPANPLNHSASLDAAIPGGDGEDAGTLGELRPDPAAAQAFEDAEHAVYVQQLHDALETALDKLPANQARAVRARYYEGALLRQCAEAQGISVERARTMLQDALRRLRRCRELRPWMEELREQMHARAYHGTGLAAWRSGGSVEERSLEWLERQEQERLEAMEAREQERQQAFVENLAKGLGWTVEEVRTRWPNL